MTTYGSLFSGVGGFDLGCDAAGWDCQWQVEWDQKARSVLARHWPDVPRYEDVRDVNGHTLTPVDVITYGFPCQDLSVAGKRAGLDGDRSGLFFEAVRIIREMREATGGTYPRIAVAENVLGLLNADKGDAMGRCLDALAEVGALAVEWRVLDAQWFGVPQRRRRVFLVACFDSGAASRGPVLPEPASVSGNPAAGDQTRQEVAGTLGGGSGSRGWAADTERMTFVPDRTNSLTARGNPGNARDAETQGFIFPDGQPEVSATVTDRMTFVPATHTHTPQVVGMLSPGAHPGGVDSQQVHSGQLIPTIVGALTTKMERYGSPEVDGAHYLPQVIMSHTHTGSGGDVEPDDGGGRYS